jgi:hypothetical protein
MKKKIIYFNSQAMKKMMEKKMMRRMTRMKKMTKSS